MQVRGSKDAICNRPGACVTRDCSGQKSLPPRTRIDGLGAETRFVGPWTGAVPTGEMLNFAVAVHSREVLRHDEIERDCSARWIGGEAVDDNMLDPDQIAETYLHLDGQHRSTWTFEEVMRPWLECW